MLVSSHRILLQVMMSAVAMRGQRRLGRLLLLLLPGQFSAVATRSTPQARPALLLHSMFDIDSECSAIKVNARTDLAPKSSLHDDLEGGRPMI